MKTAHFTRAAIAAIAIGWGTLPAMGVPVVFTTPGAGEAFAQRLVAASLTVTTVKDEDSTAQDVLAAAQSDYGRMVGVLYDRGFYDGLVSILVNGQEAADISPLRAPEEIESINIRVIRGAPFVFDLARVAPLAPGTMLSEGFRVGKRARGELVLEATRTAISDWREIGHAKARVSGQDLVADHARATLTANVTLDPGPRLRFGEIVVERTERGSRVRDQRIREIAGLPTGKVFSPDEQAAAANRLRRSGAFRSVVVNEAETPNPDGTLDMDTRVVDAAPRRIGVGAELGSSEGVTLSGFWLHRNLLGGAERLRLDAMVGNIGGSDGDLDFRLGARIDRPATFTPDTGAFLVANIEQKDEDNFRERRAEIGGGITHRFSGETTAEAGLTYQYSEITDDLGKRELQHLLLPLRATTDRRDDPLNPLSGLYLDVSATPFLRLDESAAGSRLFVDLRDYLTLGEASRVTLAGRAQLGSIAGASIRDIPANMLFYSGGAGTVRGQRFESLGVDLPDGGTVGGRSFMGFSGELRTMVTDKVQAVAFADTGFVGADALGTGSGNWHSGAGLGVRYFTAVGPVRLDIAAPIDDRDEARNIEVYIGIGQAF